MSEFVINDTTAATPIGELLRKARSGEVVLLDADRNTIAWLRCAEVEPFPPLRPHELEEIDRRSRGDRSEFLSTDELLRRLNAGAGRT